MRSIWRRSSVPGAVFFPGSVLTALVLAGLFFAVIGCARDTPEGRGHEMAAAVKAGAGTGESGSEEAGEALPRLVDLGRGTCIPCKQMAPILAELARTYEGKAEIEVIDLRERPEEATRYGIRLIPTQIFFGADGKEVWRHEGFLPREEIVARFSQMGVEGS